MSVLLTFVHRSHIDHNYSSNSGVVSIFLKLHKTFPVRRVTPVRDEDYQVVHSEPLVLMENAALSSPHALNSTRTCGFFSARAHTSAAFSLQRNATPTQSFASPRCKTVHTAESKQRKSKPSDASGHTGVNSPASGSKKAHLIGFKERKVPVRPRLNSIQQQTPAAGSKPGLEVFTAPWRAQSADRPSERMPGNLSGGDSDGEQKKTLTETLLPFPPPWWKLQRESGCTPSCAWG